MNLSGETIFRRTDSWMTRKSKSVIGPPVFAYHHRAASTRPSFVSDILLARSSRAFYLNHSMHPILPAPPVGVVAKPRGTPQGPRATTGVRPQ